MLTGKPPKKFMITRNESLVRFLLGAYKRNCSQHFLRIICVDAQDLETRISAHYSCFSRHFRNYVHSHALRHALPDHDKSACFQSIASFYVNVQIDVLLSSAQISVLSTATQHDTLLLIITYRILLTQCNNTHKLHNTACFSSSAQLDHRSQSHIQNRRPCHQRVSSHAHWCKILCQEAKMEMGLCALPGTLDPGWSWVMGGERCVGKICVSI